MDTSSWKSRTATWNWKRHRRHWQRGDGHPSSVTVSPHTPRPFLKLAPSHFVHILTCLLLDSGVVEVCGVIRWMKGGDFLSLCTVSNWSSRKTRRFYQASKLLPEEKNARRQTEKLQENLLFVCLQSSPLAWTAFIQSSDHLELKYTDIQALMAATATPIRDVSG